MPLKIHVYNRQRELPISVREVRALIRASLEFEDILCDEVSVYFVDVPTICQLHEQYFNDPSPTDCISFPMDDEEECGYRILGEIFISPRAAIEYAENKHGDPFDELSLYIIHGLLHLTGYDDINPKARAKMRLAEKRHLKYIESKNISLHPLH